MTSEKYSTWKKAENIHMITISGKPLLLRGISSSREPMLPNTLTGRRMILCLKNVLSSREGLMFAANGGGGNPENDWAFRVWLPPIALISSFYQRFASRVNPYFWLPYNLSFFQSDWVYTPCNPNTSSIQQFWAEECRPWSSAVKYFSGFEFPWNSQLIVPSTPDQSSITLVFFCQNSSSGFYFYFHSP